MYKAAALKKKMALANAIYAKLDKTFVPICLKVS